MEISFTRNSQHKEPPRDLMALGETGRAEGWLALAGSSCLGGSWFFEIPPAPDASQIDRNGTARLPECFWVQLESIALFSQPKKPRIFLRALLNLEITRGKFSIGKDIPSQSSHTTKYHYLCWFKRQSPLTFRTYVSITGSACLLVDFTSNMHFLENVQRSLSLEHYLVIDVFPAC